MNKNSLPLVYDQSQQQVAETMKAIGQPAYRAKQLWQGIYQNLWSNPSDFSNFPAGLRDQIGSTYRFGSFTIGTRQVSRDQQTVKTLFHLPDGKAIETVLMRYEHRQTLCISTQAGCAMNCVFCATGQMGFKRHLTSGEIVEQVLYYARLLKEEGKEVTNIVIMGMGEPFHNYNATLEAIDRLNDPDGFNLGARRFTISTVGLVPAIQRFSNEKRQVNLAISLHAANDDLRSSLLPINKTYPLSELIPACREYVEKTGRRITFEWALINGVNDRIEDASQLARLIRGIICHVNVISLNPTRAYQGVGSSAENARAFCDELTKHHIPCTIRLRRGIDIQAGCGQLAIKAPPPPML